MICECFRGCALDGVWYGCCLKVIKTMCNLDWVEHIQPLCDVFLNMIKAFSVLRPALQQEGPRLSAGVGPGPGRRTMMPGSHEPCNDWKVVGATEGN